MKTIDLNFSQRLKLNELLSEQSGPLKTTAPYMRVLNFIRFTETEDQQIIKTKVSPTVTTYSSPSADFGKLKIELENADCVAITDLLKSWANFTTLDHQWCDPLLESLEKT